MLVLLLGLITMGIYLNIFWYEYKVIKTDKKLIQIEDKHYIEIFRDKK